MMGLLDAGRGWLFLVIAVDLGGDLTHLALRGNPFKICAHNKI